MHSHHHKHATLAPSDATEPTTLAQSGDASGEEDHNAHLMISPEAIRLYAHRKWERAGKPTGDGVQFWLEAEQELVPKKAATSAGGHSQDADRHSKTRHPHSQKKATD